MARIKIIGIYKITSPSGKIYIGQSRDLDKRLKSYKCGSSKTKGQPKLYNSFEKYGILTHEFEIIEECDFELLNIRERYWQDFYDVCGDGGLNCSLTGRKHKQESKEKISIKAKGRMHGDAAKKKMSETRSYGGNFNAKLVLNFETGIYYDCGKEAWETLHGCAHSTFRQNLNGNVKKNRFAMEYV